MGLSIDDRLKHLLPGWLYYSHKIAKEGRGMEPELRILRDIVPRGRTAIDVGANRGYYSYALSKFAGRVEAFEPNPTIARFARRKLGASVRLHQVALSNHAGSAALYIPQCKNEIDVHFAATLKRPQKLDQHIEVPVRVMTLDDFDFNDVGFIKIDAEGSDMEVIEGGRKTIARDKPNLLAELLPYYADPLRCIEQTEETFGYCARIMVDGELVDARQALRQGKQSLKTFNVLFTPSPGVIHSCAVNHTLAAVSYSGE